MSQIIISLKPQFAELIESGIKTHEFRKKVPLDKPNEIWVYLTRPVAELAYIIKVNDYIEYPQKIKKIGRGNIDFNNGKKTKYAYPIKNLYKLKKPIPLSELRKSFGFVAPQNFAYIEKYEKLKKFVVANKEIEKIF